MTTNMWPSCDSTCGLNATPHQVFYVDKSNLNMTTIVPISLNMRAFRTCIETQSVRKGQSVRGIHLTSRPAVGFSENWFWNFMWPQVWVYQILYASNSGLNMTTNSGSIQKSMPSMSNLWGWPLLFIFDSSFR